MSTTVVIVGAGISGLSCALHLLTRNNTVNVVIVEGRDVSFKKLDYLNL